MGCPKVRTLLAKRLDVPKILALKMISNSQYSIHERNGPLAQARNTPLTPVHLILINHPRVKNVYLMPVPGADKTIQNQHRIADRAYHLDVRTLDGPQAGRLRL